MHSFNIAFTLTCLALTALGRSFGKNDVQKRDDNLPARVPYVFPPPGESKVADEIRSRRPNGALLDLDGVLLNSEPLALAWNQVAESIRDNNPIPGDMRELIILRTAVVNNAAYEWIQHESVGRQEGLTTAQLQTIRFTPIFAGLATALSTLPVAPNGTLTPALAAALDFTDWSAAAVHVPDEIYNNLQTTANLNDTQMIYASATAGFYAWVSRFTVGLNIDDKMSVGVPIPG
ncbi:AhpD-like protein [Amylostereum chailletii]|nr:AhpD-like protein [Amylostereum chailletii]